jgi:two-component system, LuxR family, response regulator FixJ
MNVKGSAAESPLVSIVDDDASTRRSVQRLISSFGFRTEAFASAQDFLESGRVQEAALLVLDVRMPDMDGLELQDLLGSNNYRIPIIFATAHASDDQQRRATQAGAVAFLRKPVSEQTLISEIQAALRQGRQDENEHRNPKI